MNSIKKLSLNNNELDGYETMDKLNHANRIQAQFEAGLIDFYMKNYMVWYIHASNIVFVNNFLKLITQTIDFLFQKPRIDQCLMENQKDSAGQKPLTLRDMSSAFVVLGLGISLSILAFLLELIYKRIQQHYYQIN